MESGKQLDTSGSSGFRKLILLLLFSLGLTVVPASAVPQKSTSHSDDRVAQVKALYDSGLWAAVAEAVPETVANPVPLEPSPELALAQLESLTAAWKTFQAGL